MRKMLMALVALFAMAGLVVAVEVTVVKFDKDKKEITVKEGDKEKTYKISDKAKFSVTDKDGNSKEVKYEDFEKRASGKGGKNGIKLDIKTEKEELTEATWKGRAPKN
ncbi:hypothetical protein VT84_10325 [Gemmata sp. SH-PL17]|uniref:hypothetical protein n=1 Tax=Gemmata sp. SH-PL17 TaxID=1630693 RepID=UPI0004B20B97|nr:hypothetical protein [Gemmata sp. SH-PL17]AMV24782.1 hypothetical protein VT84_10325 [Gemmata sp. SH-PL17]